MFNSSIGFNKLKFIEYFSFIFHSTIVFQQSIMNGSSNKQNIITKIGEQTREIILSSKQNIKSFIKFVTSREKKKETDKMFLLVNF